MNRLKSIVILCICITCAIGLVSFVYGEEVDNVIEEAFEDGYATGKLEGYLDKKRDIPMDFKNNMPKAAFIEGKYEKYKDDRNTMNKIVESYKTGYTRGYIEGYYSDIFPDDNKDKENNTTYGKVFGSLLGEISGEKDFTQGKKNKCVNSKPSDKTIVSMFNLDKETSNYRTTFLKNFKEYFQRSYEESYRQANFEGKKHSYEDGIENGEIQGKLYGEICGEKDYFEGKSNKWNRLFPTEKELTKIYGLNNDYESYSNGFLKGYRKAYEESYEASFRKRNIELNLKKGGNAFNSGKIIGDDFGRQAAEVDYYLKNDRDSKRHLTSDSNIIEDFNLNLADKISREGFISGYRSGFTEEYYIRYEELNNEYGLKKRNTIKIPSSGGSFQIDEKLNMNVLTGTYYNDVLLTVTNLGDNSKYRNMIKEAKLTSISDFYEISIKNNIDKYNNENKIELYFEYCGTPKIVGIYKIVNDELVYIKSFIEEGKIKTSISPNSMGKEGSIFVVCIDDNYRECYDIRGHWARDEIDVFLRRKYMTTYKDKTFRPNGYMTKGQLLMTLSNVYKWDLPKNIDEVSKMADYNEFKHYGNVVEYCLKNGYIAKDKKNKMNMNSTMSYREVEDLMRKIMGSENFKWSNISNKMLYNKEVRSKSFNGYNNKITRGEAVYMLYLLNEWKI